MFRGQFALNLSEKSTLTTIKFQNVDIFFAFFFAKKDPKVKEFVYNAVINLLSAADLSSFSLAIKDAYFCDIPKSNPIAYWLQSQKTAFSFFFFKELLLGFFLRENYLEFTRRWTGDKQ